jgi:hypothetical protein
MTMLLGVGPQIETKYVLTGPDGTRAVFNDQLDADYVGHLTDITGLDSPEVRENAEDLVQFDGGVHGDFFYGRRPIVMEGITYDHGTSEERNSRIARLQRASNAMRGDATLTWTPDGSVPLITRVRRQQPLRVSGGWNKNFQAALVAEDPRIYSADLHTSEVVAGSTGTTGFGFNLSFNLVMGIAPPVGQLIVGNAGNELTYPIYIIYGPGSNPSVTNYTTGEKLTLNAVLDDTDVFVVDMLNRTASMFQRVTVGGDTLDPATEVSRYSSVDFYNTQWHGLVPGANDLRLGYYTHSVGAKLRVDWRDAWL